MGICSVGYNFIISASYTSICPYVAPKCSGVCFFIVKASKVAPFFLTKRSTKWPCPFCAAKCKAVHPAFVLLFTKELASIKALQTSSLPYSLAKCKEDFPS